MKKSTLIIFIAIALSAQAETCQPTFNNRGIGPVYKMDAPHKNNKVCDIAHSDNHLYVARGDWCFGPACWMRTVKEVPSVRFFVQGTVRNAADCSPIPGAELDLWQTDAHGKYGSLQIGEEDGFCRAVVTADQQGHYEFTTELPGLYGILNGALAPFDLPPFAPQHIHLLVYQKGFDLLGTQFYFPNDPARHYDWREGLAVNVSLMADNEGLSLPYEPCTRNGEPWVCATKDIVLVPDPDAGADSNLSRVEILRNRLCKSKHFDMGEPIPLCNPQALKFFRWYVIVGVLFVVLATSFTLVMGLLRLVIGKKPIASQAKKRQ